MIRLLLIFSSLIISSSSIFSQQTNIAEATHSSGFYLKKVVSNTNIASGQNFSYTIYYTFPAGTQNATITDILPSSLVFQSLSVGNNCGSFTTSTPTVGSNGTVSITWNNIPSGGCSNSFTIDVSFPNGITCDSTFARNRVCLKAQIKNPNTGNNEAIELCTPYVITMAQASNTWQIQKQILGATWVGGNCPWKFAGDTVTYRICVWKNNPPPNGIYGQLNLVGGVVTDVLPTGAQFINSNCGAYVSGSTITWNIGNLSATQQYNQVCCDIKIYYPQSLYPNGTQITNTAVLTGQLGSTTQPCGQFYQSNSVCWTKVAPPPDTTLYTLWKWVTTTGQPGCGGYYTIRLCNSGTTPISQASITDTIPSSLNITSISMWPAGTFTVSQTGNLIIANQNTTLNPGNCFYLYVNFNISNSVTPNSTITNCATAQLPGFSPVQACASFVVNSPEAKACILKEICNPQNSYSPGQIIRIRFRIQNTGGQNINGATITDNLNSNFEYIGNPVFYTSNTWNINCNPSNITQWNPTPSISSSGQTITIQNIVIPASCQSLFWNGCGAYGNYSVPYYFVEFDIKIRDTSALGNIPNFYTISGGGLPNAVQSNTVLILVTGTSGFTLNKSVSSDTTNWQNNLTTTAGSIANYKLSINVSPGSIPLRHLTFVDLLPLNNGSNDDKILQMCNSRNSQFSVSYNGTFISSSPATGYKNPTTSLADANTISAATSAPSNLFPNNCGTAGTWTSGLGIGDKNLGFYFGTNTITNASIRFPIKISPNASTSQFACNTFAAGGTVSHYLNSNSLYYIPVGSLESNPVCINIDSTNKCFEVQFQSVNPLGQVSTPHGNACKYNLTVSLINQGPTINGCVYTSAGTITPTNFVVPNGTTNLSFTFTDTPPQNSIACFVFGIVGSNNQCLPCDTVCVDLPPCPTQDTCCPKLKELEINCIGADSLGNINYNICATGNINCQATLVISTNEGYFTPSTFSIGTGIFNFCTNFTDVPPFQSALTIHYYIVFNGIIYCSDSIKIQLPECPTSPSRSCCDFILPKITSSVISLSNGMVTLNGLVSASSPIQNFKVSLVSAQLKKWCPILPPPPPSPWQRIYGDITSGLLLPAPGPSSILTPFSRQIEWQSAQVPQDCIDWSQNPALFKINMIFPATTSFKCYDSLKFTVSFSFTDCKCTKCDTLITYVVVRKKVFLYFPWENVQLQQISENHFKLHIPNLSTSSDDGKSKAEINSIELNWKNPKNLRLLSVEPQNSSVQIFDGIIGKVSVTGLDPKLPLSLYFENYDKNNQTINLHYIAKITEEKNIETITGDLEIDIPSFVSKDKPFGELAHDIENRPNYVRTFALALINGDIPTEEISVEIRALPQPNGSVPNIIAIGPINHSSVDIKKRESDGKTYWNISHGLEAGAIFRPLYITISDAKRETMDAVEIEYFIRDAKGILIGAGRLILQGAVSGIILNEDNSQLQNIIDIGSVIPNPAFETVTIALNSITEVKNVDLFIVDNLGKTVKNILSNATLPQGTTAIPISISNLPNGAYIINLKTSFGNSNKKLIINK